MEINPRDSTRDAAEKPLGFNADTLMHAGSIARVVKSTPRAGGAARR